MQTLTIVRADDKVLRLPAADFNAQDVLATEVDYRWAEHERRCDGGGCPTCWRYMDAHTAVHLGARVVTVEGDLYVLSPATCPEHPTAESTHEDADGSVQWDCGCSA